MDEFAVRTPIMTLPSVRILVRICPQAFGVVYAVIISKREFTVESVLRRSRSRSRCRNTVIVVAAKNALSDGGVCFVGHPFTPH